MIEKIEEIINRAEYFKSSYFWKSFGNAAVRRAYEKKYSVEEIKWTEGKDTYTAKLNVKCSVSNIYAN